jgi:hypothetical protein
MIVGLCGAVCSECDAFDREMCKGCFAKNIATDSPCGIWACIREKGISSCDMCELMDCETFKAYTDECIGFERMARRMKVR